MITLDPLNDKLSEVTIVDHYGSDLSVVRAARVSFGHDLTQFDDVRDHKLIKYLLRHGHTSPFYHNMITFRIKAPIFVDRQMVRSHVGVAKNEISARYTEVKDEYYAPLSFRGQAVSNRQASQADGVTMAAQLRAQTKYLETCNNAFTVYQELLQLGVAREQARAVLPLCTYTVSYYSFNLASLLQFIKIRDHEGSQYEIQQYAKAMKQLASPFFPSTFQAVKELYEEQSL